MQADSDRYRFRVRWEPFLLRPGMPPEGISKGPLNPDSLKGDRLVKAGHNVGIDFTYKCRRYPYTLFAHALSEFVGEKYGAEKQNELVENIFKAYFTDGLYPDVDTLCSLADQLGLNKDEARSVMTDEQRVQQAKVRAKDWSSKGVTGVPCFFINGKEAFSGAQDPAAFQQVFKIVAEKFPIQEQSSQAS